LSPSAAANSINFMNQPWRIDSKHSLDTVRFASENSCMLPNRVPQFLRRIDATRNMARFYALSLQPTLFGQTSLVRNWGRIGTRGRQKVELFDAENNAAVALSKLATRKRKRGYIDSGS
jgi:predicted DNA-binding WGR domain protein